MSRANACQFRGRQKLTQVFTPNCEPSNQGTTSTKGQTSIQIFSLSRPRYFYHHTLFSYLEILLNWHINQSYRASIVVLNDILCENKTDRFVQTF